MTAAGYRAARDRYEDALTELRAARNALAEAEHEAGDSPDMDAARQPLGAAS